MQHDVVMTVGPDLAKNVFQVHAISVAGGVLIRRQLQRAEVLKFFAALPPCLVGMEACASAHHWGREMMALERDIRFMTVAGGRTFIKPRGRTRFQRAGWHDPGLKSLVAKIGCATGFIRPAAEARPWASLQGAPNPALNRPRLCPQAARISDYTDFPLEPPSPSHLQGPMRRAECHRWRRSCV